MTTAPEGKASGPKIAALASEFGLSPAEMRVAALIAQGLGAKAAARELNVSYHTVRYQLKSIFDKKDTRRQSARGFSCTPRVSIGGTHDKIDFTGGHCRVARHRPAFPGLWPRDGCAAGVPALVGAARMSDDPVFQAMAALEQLKIHAEGRYAAYEIAEAAAFAAREEKVVILDGKEMRTHEQIDAHFRPAFGPEDEDQFNRFVERLRPRRLSDTERAERDRARQAAHDELARQEAASAEAKQRTEIREIEAEKEAAEDAVLDAEYAVMEATPASTAGAVALLRFVADDMEICWQDDPYAHCIEALRNVADFFEGRASARARSPENQRHAKRRHRPARPNNAAPMSLPRRKPRRWISNPGRGKSIPESCLIINNSRKPDLTT